MATASTQQRFTRPDKKLLAFGMQSVRPRRTSKGLPAIDTTGDRPACNRQADQVAIVGSVEGELCPGRL